MIFSGLAKAAHECPEGHPVIKHRNETIASHLPAFGAVCMNDEGQIGREIQDLGGVDATGRSEAHQTAEDGCTGGDLRGALS
jgi:hypothetical protein